MINLDCMTEEELLNVASVLVMLAAYAKAKAEAMVDRKVGRIEAAIRNETMCEVWYKGFPEWARW